MSPKISISFFIFLISSIFPHSSDQNPLTAGTPIPSYPTAVHSRAGKLTCHLDLTSELFGGVSTACSTLDRDRCCPVLAAWLFAAHARTALALPPAPPAVSSPLSDDVVPLMPEDSQKCADSLHRSLEARNIKLPRPNATCDTVLCFCGIRLHQIGSLTCPSAFNLTSPPLPRAAGGNVTGGGEGNATTLAAPTSAVRQLERDCQNSSFLGCTRCLHSLEKLKRGGQTSAKGMSERGERMLDRDCQMMGLTWLLAKNKTLYIPTVSAVIRAMLYSSQLKQQDHDHPAPAAASNYNYRNSYSYRCRADQENMPLAVDSLQFQKLDSSSSSFAVFSVYSLSVLLIITLLSW